MLKGILKFQRDVRFPRKKYAPSSISESVLRSAFSSPAFAELIESFSSHAEGRLTSTISQATLFELSKLLAPTTILEIGSYFGNTSRILAQSVAKKGGSLVTIDPFGGDRLPGIIAGWPSGLSKVTTFYPLNSMSFFASLEVAHTPTGRDAPFNLIFVDGHHSFEYAFFDILSSALYLKPGGVIVVDNIEQAGPAMAVEAFLARYRSWKLFSQSGEPLDPAFPESVPGASGAILLSPPGVEIGQIPYKFALDSLKAPEVPVIRLPLIPRGQAGTLAVSANLYSAPYDLHITGVGLVAKVVNRTLPINGQEQVIEIAFDDELRIKPHSAKGHITLDLELRFYPSSTGTHNIIVDASRDIEIT